MFHTNTFARYEAVCLSSLIETTNCVKSHIEFMDIAYKFFKRVVSPGAHKAMWII